MKQTDHVLNSRTTFGGAINLNMPDSTDDLFKVVKELQAQVEALDTQVATLQDQVDELESRA